MTPGTMPMALRRNAPSGVRLALSDASGQPIDLTDCSVALQVRLYPGAPDPALLRIGTATGEIVIDDAAGGVIEIDWPSVVGRIAAMPTSAEAGDPTRPRIDTYCYDLLLIDAGGVPQAILEGTVPVSYGVTRA